MIVYVVFGLPGAGKTYVGELLKKHFGFYFYDGDQDMPPELKEAISKQTIITDFLRDKFFNRLIANTQELSTQQNKLVVAQTFIKEKYREQLLKAIPQAKFILVEADLENRNKRLMAKKDFQLDLEYWKKMTAIFEPPKIAYSAVKNNEEGEEALLKQLQTLVT